MLQPAKILGPWRLIRLQQGIHLRQGGLYSTGRLSAVCRADGLQQQSTIRGSIFPIIKAPWHLL